MRCIGVRGIDFDITWLQEPQEPPRADDRRVQLLAAPPQLPVRRHHQATLVPRDRLRDRRRRSRRPPTRARTPPAPAPRPASGRRVVAGGGTQSPGGAASSARAPVVLEPRHGVAGAALEDQHPGRRAGPRHRARRAPSPPGTGAARRPPGPATSRRPGRPSRWPRRPRPTDAVLAIGAHHLTFGGLLHVLPHVS